MKIKQKTSNADKSKIVVGLKKQQNDPTRKKAIDTKKFIAKVLAFFNYFTIKIPYAQPT